MGEQQSPEIGMKALIASPTGKEWRYLFIVRRKNGKLDVPGGRVEEKDSETALKRYNDAHQAPKLGLGRDVQEETGLVLELDGEDEPVPIDLCRITRPEKRDVVRITNLAKLAVGPIKLSDEHTDFMWLTRKEALERNTDESLERLLKDDQLFEFERLGAPEELSLQAIKNYIDAQYFPA
jgi:8-oxo-dGTP pyrophosphatase MutT (NUDIX family)